MPLLKNLLQMSRLNIRKSHQSNYSSLPRVASFIGTSNQKELLTAPTGSRRFLCIEVNEEIDSSSINHAQLYAQLKTLLDQGERYWMNKEEEAPGKKSINPFIGSLPKKMSSTAIFISLFPTNPSRRIPQQKSTVD